MRFGVDYYPEHWPHERWEHDAILMKEAGIELVRMAEFAWAKMEPELGKFDFTWLDEAISVMARHGIKSVLGTPTPTPPIWIIEANPDILPIDINGVRRGFGGRHHNCQSNQNYHKHIERFVRKMTEHYKDNSNVIGWQIDNEFGNSHQNLCTCDSCQMHFQQWLERKYGTIEQLNEKWGTVFWSQTYSRFDQIPPPLPTPNAHNPSLLLDWKRFSSDMIVDFQRLQLNIIRRECPKQFITHNFMGFFDKVDYFDLAEDLDFISHDQYPMHFREDRIPLTQPHELAMTLDLMRGTKQKPFWIMEQLAGPTGWEVLSSTPRPGQIRLWTYHSVAHGADTVVYFRWRTCLFGTEEYWHGILPHSGVPGRRYEEVRQTIEELAPVMEACKGGMPGAEAGILYSYDQRWAFQIQPHHPELDYLDHLKGYYKAFHDANVPVDLLSLDDDYSRYKLLVAPLLFLMTPELSSKLHDYVAQGGHLVLTMRTGVKEWNNSVIPETLPGSLSDLLGIQIFDYDCLRQFEQSVQWTCSEGGAEQISEAARKWCDIITLSGAEALASYELDFYKGTPAITRNGYENGTAYYTGTELGPKVMKALVEQLLEDAGIKGLASTPEGLEITRRRGKDSDYLFVLNHNSDTIVWHIPPGWEVVVGKSLLSANVLTMPAYGTVVFKTC
jgi:beta-galactosidase